MDAETRQLIFKDPVLSIPDSFFERNEADFRCALVRGPHQPDIEHAFRSVDEAALKLCEAVKQDFPPEAGIVFDIFNNLLMIKKIPLNTSEETKQNYGGAVDRFGKSISRRWTTANVENARAQYVAATEAATSAVAIALRQLSNDLSQVLIPIVQATHLCVVLQVAVGHTTSSKRKGWCVPTMITPDAAVSGGRAAFSVEGMTPYWLSRSSATVNSYTMPGLILLTVRYTHIYTVHVDIYIYIYIYIAIYMYNIYICLYMYV